MPKQIRYFLCNTNLKVIAVAVLVVGMLGVLLARTRAEERRTAKDFVSYPGIPIYKQRIRLWVHGDGIRPRIVHAKPGAVLLTCENKTILNAELIIDRVFPNQTIQALGAVAISTERGRATQELLLPEGEYVIYERSRPELKATLVVSPQSL